MRRPWRRCARTSPCFGCPRRQAKVKGKKAAPKITKITQLAGHRIGVVGRTEANVNLLKVILQQYGVDPAKVEIVQFPVTEAVDAIRNQKADAYLAAGPLNSKITSDAIAASMRDGGTPTFLAIDSAEAIAQNHPAYEASEIPAGTFGGAPAKPEEEVKTISFSHHIVARKGVSDSTIAIFTRQLFAIRQTLKNEFPLAAKIETPDTDKDANIPVHPGAAAFVDGEEKTFFERYSDFIWWGLMGLSAMGSAGAWFAGYLKKDERIASNSQRDRLLDMLAAARNCDSTEELDQMQTEADGILRHMLECFEHGAVEEGALTTFNIALEQFHNAVADRKALLDEHAAEPATGERAVPGRRRLSRYSCNSTVMQNPFLGSVLRHLSAATDRARGSHDRSNFPPTAFFPPPQRRALASSRCPISAAPPTGRSSPMACNPATSAPMAAWCGRAPTVPRK